MAEKDLDLLMLNWLNRQLIDRRNEGEDDGSKWIEACRWESWSTRSGLGKAIIISLFKVDYKNTTKNFTIEN